MAARGAQACMMMEAHLERGHEGVFQQLVCRHALHHHLRQHTRGAQTHLQRNQAAESKPGSNSATAARSGGRSWVRVVRLVLTIEVM